MSFFSRFTRPKWQHPNPEVREKAIRKIDRVETLLEILEAEGKRELRALCLSRIDDDACLETLSKHVRPDVREGARVRRLERLLPNGRETLGTIRDADALVTIAALTDDDTLRLDAIRQIEDHAVRSRLAIDHPSAHVRFAAAEGIQDLDLLREIAGAAQGKDKRLFRLCKERLDRHDAAERAAREQQEAFATWHDTVTSLSETNDLGRLARIRTQYLELESAWQTLRVGANDDQLASGKQALEKLDKVVSDTLAARERANARALELEQASAEQAVIITAMADGLDQPANIPEMEQQWRDLSARWRAAADASPPTAQTLGQFEKLRDGWWLRRDAAERVTSTSQDIEKQLTAIASADASNIDALNAASAELSALMKQLAWPKGMHPPKEIEALNTARENLDDARSALFANTDQNLAAVDEKLAEFEAALSEGQVRLAGRRHREAEDLLHRVERARADAQVRKLGNLVSQLRSAQDWESFAVVPKQEELCRRMEALAEAFQPRTSGLESKSGAGPDELGEESRRRPTPDADPDARLNPISTPTGVGVPHSGLPSLAIEQHAEQINELQAEWRALKGPGGKEGRALWNRFKRAGDKAYEPCRHHFAAQAEERKTKLAARLELCEQLEQYESQLDWSHADWPSVKKTLELARASFRSASPVERGAHHRSKKRFDAVADRIYAHIKKENDDNISAKERLIEQADALAKIASEGGDDGREALEGLKQLQNDWRKIGITPPRVDQRLWKTFRAACDSAFEARDEQRAQHKLEESALIDEQIARADALRAAMASTSVGDLRELLAEARQQLNSAQLPRGVNGRLERTLADLEQRLGKRVDDERRKEIQRRWTRLTDAMTACRERARGLAPSPPDWEDPSAYPNGIDLGALEQRWERAQNLAGPDEIDRLRRMCLTLELSIGAPSPENERELRMAAQLERLQQGMGQGNAVDASSRVELINQWLVSPIDPVLDERFQIALRHLDPDST